MKALVLFLIGLALLGFGIWGAKHFYPINLIPTAIGGIMVGAFGSALIYKMFEWIEK